MCSSRRAVLTLAGAVGLSLALGPAAAGDDKPPPPTLDPGVRVPAGTIYELRYAEDFTYSKVTKGTVRKKTTETEGRFEWVFALSCGARPGKVAMDLESVSGWTKTDDGKQSPFTATDEDSANVHATWLSNLFAQPSVVTLDPQMDPTAVAGGAKFLSPVHEEFSRQYQGTTVMSRWFQPLPKEPVVRGGTFRQVRTPTIFWRAKPADGVGVVTEIYTVSSVADGAAVLTIAGRGKKRVSRKRPVTKNRVDILGMRAVLVGWSVKGTATVDLATGLARSRNTTESYHEFGWETDPDIDGYNIRSVEKKTSFEIEMTVEPRAK